MAVCVVTGDIRRRKQKKEFGRKVSNEIKSKLSEKFISAEAVYTGSAVTTHTG